VLGLLPGTKLVLPPLPRYLYKPCCDSEGHCQGIGDPLHASELLAKCQEVRKQIKEYFAGKPSAVWVPDLLQDMFPDCTNFGSLATALGQFYAQDGVHLTKNGYGLVADIVIECIKKRDTAAIHVSGPRGGLKGEKPKSYFWRGFASPVGTERPRENYFSHKHKHVGKIRSFTPAGGGGGVIPPPTCPLGAEVVTRLKSV